MRTLINQYINPEIYEHKMCMEGLLCTSSSICDGDNESYGGVPGEDETIF